MEFKKELPAAVNKEIQSCTECRADDQEIEILSEEQAYALFREDFVTTLRLRRDGKYQNIFDNYCEIIENDPYFRGRIKANLHDGRSYIAGAFWDANTHPFRDTDLSEVRKMCSGLYELDNKKDIADAIKMVAMHNAFHPIQERLKSIIWDGQERISNLFPRYLGADRSPYTTAVTLTLFHGLIQRVFDPGCKFDLCVVLEDHKQGTGKSSMCMFLALEDKWFTDSLPKLGDPKTEYEAIEGIWICELSEMNITEAIKDNGKIKAFLTRRFDKYREPYSVYSENIPRQCVFIGTTNRIEYLPDDKSGNRRFIPLHCDGEKAEKHPMADVSETRAYIEQCYAEAMVIGNREGWQLVIPKEFQDELKAAQEVATPEDPKVGIIQHYLDDTKAEYVCSKMIFDRAFSSSPRCFRQGMSETDILKEISEIVNLNTVGWIRYRGKDGQSIDAKHRFPGYGAQRAWVRISDNEEEVPDISKEVDSINEVAPAISEITDDLDDYDLFGS